MSALAADLHELAVVIRAKAQPEYQAQETGATAHVRVACFELAVGFETPSGAALADDHIPAKVGRDKCGAMTIFLTHHDDAKRLPLVDQVIVVADMMHLSGEKGAGVRFLARRA